MKAPVISIFKRGMILNTLNCCWFMASGFVLYYCINVLFVTHLQVDLKMSPERSAKSASPPIWSCSSPA